MSSNARGLPPITDELIARTNLSRERLEELRERMVERDRRTPAVGSEAPDFEIERLSATGTRTGETFRLSSARGRPVALVFGSYT